MIGAARTAGPVVRVTGLTKIYRDFWLRPRVVALDGVDLEVGAGEVFGLLGPNGSGKSTTIKILLGLLFPTRGEVQVLGVRAGARAARAQIGYVPEDSHLYPFLGAAETLDYYGRIFGLPRRERRQRTAALLELVGLSDAQQRPVGEFSKGMQRRLLLAQGLINDPRLLILDEPTAGLDPIGTREVKDLILALQAAGKTILLSSHLLADVEDVCTRMAILYGGRVHALGSANELLAREDRTLLETDPVAGPTLERLRELLAAEGLELHGVRAPRHRLEDLFLDIVSRARQQGATTSGAGLGGRLPPFLGAG